MSDDLYTFEPWYEAWGRDRVEVIHIPGVDLGGSDLVTMQWTSSGIFNLDVEP